MSRVGDMSPMALATSDTFWAQKRLDVSVHFQAVRHIAKMSPSFILCLHIMDDKLSLMDMHLTILVNIFVCLHYCHHFTTINIIVNVIIVTILIFLGTIMCDFYRTRLAKTAT